jgi:hypothetical protein
MAQGATGEHVPQNNELQLTSGTCCGRVEPLRGTTRWLS